MLLCAVMCCDVLLAQCVTTRTASPATGNASCCAALHCLLRYLCLPCPTFPDYSRSHGGGGAIGKKLAEAALVPSFSRCCSATGLVRLLEARTLDSRLAPRAETKVNASSQPVWPGPDRIQ